MKVIVMIGGREAIPVRAIPLLTNWETMSSDYLAKSLAGDEHFYHFEGLKAYRLEEGIVAAVPATYWDNVVCTRLDALSDRIKAKEVSHKAGLNEWRSESLKALPAGVFVWRDEFEPRHIARFRESMSYVKSLHPMVFRGREEQEERTELNYSPFDVGELGQAVIMEGFDSEVAACATQTTPCDEFTAFSPLFAPWIESPFEALPKSLQDQWRTESMVAWDVLAPHQRKFFLQQRDFKNDPSTQVERTAAWLMHTMDADMWWRTEAVTPVHAAMLLSRWNPNNMSAEDAETHSSDEMGPQDFRRLRNTFEGADKSANRTLQHWVDYARQRNLRIHSWIGEWEECIHALQADTEQRVECTAPLADSASNAPACDFSMLATRGQLIEAFGRFTGMDASWFKSIKDTPALQTARKVVGQGGRGHIAEPWFCPFEVMQWLADSKRRKGRKLSVEKAWELLERNFPKVHSARSVADPRTGD